MSIGCPRDSPGSTDRASERESPGTMRERSAALLRETVAEADAEGAVVCLSGGVDSATTAALAVDALGASAVTALVMPTAANDEANTSDAVELATDLGVDHATVPLDPALDVFKRHVAPRIAPAGDEVAAGNLAARLRMACAYYVANATDSVVVGTGNRTERLLGYFTKYGDGAADVLPLGEYDKGAVRALASRLGVPTRVVEKPPTAGFWPGQTDESDLGAPYATLDRVLRALVDGGGADDSPRRIAEAAEIDADTVERLVGRVHDTAHKRERPPAPSRVPRNPETADPFAGDDGLAVRRVDRARQFVRESVADAGADGVVVCLSGGLDSSVAAALAADALGPDRVHGLFLPCHMASEVDSPDPGVLATDLGIDYDRVNVRPLVTELEAALPTGVTADAGTRELGNFVARIRMACAYYVANTSERLVLGTTNRSEDLLGYVTKYGDGAADLRPLGSAYKTEVRAMGRALDLPARVLDQEPAADFEIGRTDEDALGAGYPTIDAVLRRLVDRDLGIDRTAADLGVDRDAVRRFAALHVATGHKRTTPPTTRGADGPEYFHELELAFE
ncbi:NAD+ synthase [Halobaculum sp. EA56]|uniref:NAD+ synthase n=1 Tax=Halobaculum sp. EA56 TaxID=3421648 RepID=UPI003EC03076